MAEGIVVRRAAAAARVELSHRLGRGGQGEVWAVHRSGEDQPLALKIVRLRSASDREAFEREAEVGMIVDGITLVRTVEVVRGMRWGALLQERAEGVPLAVLLALVEEIWPVSACAHIGITLLEALARMHRAGWVHGDVAPHNVLVQRGARLRMVDYGAARPIGEHATAVLGREEFMAPEQRRGAALTPATDVYAVGRLLASMNPAAMQVTQDDLCTQDDLDPPRLHHGGSDRDLDALCACIQAMTRLTPRARPSIDDLIVRLRRLDPCSAALARHAHRCLGPATPCPDFQALGRPKTVRGPWLSRPWQRWGLAAAVGFACAGTLAALLGM